MIDKSFLEFLSGQAVVAGRQTIVREGTQTFLFRPDLDRYEELPRVVLQMGNVANVACFQALVLEEALRRGNVDGEWMTVYFQEKGAFFSPDDRVRLDGFAYERALAPEWKTIREVNGKMMKHQEFLRLLQSLRWCLSGDHSVIRAFRSIDVSRVARVASAPTMVNGRAGVTLAVDVVAKMLGGGETQASQELPGELYFCVPFARGDTTNQNLEAEVVIEMSREGEKDVVLFGFIVPDLNAAERNARAAEVARFREGLKSLPRVLVLENY